VAIAGLVAGTIGVVFLVRRKDRDAVIEAAFGIPRDLWLQFGAFRDLGPWRLPGPGRGLFGVFGGLMMMLWAATGESGRPELSE
jgi:hypothetical protein